MLEGTYTGVKREMRSEVCEVIRDFYHKLSDINVESQIIERGDSVCIVASIHLLNHIHGMRIWCEGSGSESIHIESILVRSNRENYDGMYQSEEDFSSRKHQVVSISDFISLQPQLLQEIDSWSEENSLIRLAKKMAYYASPDLSQNVNSDYLSITLEQLKQASARYAFKRNSRLIEEDLAYIASNLRGIKRGSKSKAIERVLGYMERGILPREIAKGVVELLVAAGCSEERIPSMYRMHRGSVESVSQVLEDLMQDTDNALDNLEKVYKDLGEGIKGSEVAMPRKRTGLNLLSSSYKSAKESLEELRSDLMDRKKGDHSNLEVKVLRKQYAIPKSLNAGNVFKDVDFYISD